MDANIDAVALANAHSMDYNEEGLKEVKSNNNNTHTHTGMLRPLLPYKSPTFSCPPLLATIVFQ